MTQRVIVFTVIPGLRLELDSYQTADTLVGLIKTLVVPLVDIMELDRRL